MILVRFLQELNDFLITIIPNCTKSLVRNCNKVMGSSYKIFTVPFKIFIISYVFRKGCASYKQLECVDYSYRCVTHV